MAYNKKRLSIPLSPELYAKIERDAQSMGVSTATYGNILLSQHYKQVDTITENTTQMLSKAFEQLFEKNGISLAERKKIVEDSVNDSKEALSKVLNGNDEKK